MKALVLVALLTAGCGAPTPTCPPYTDTEQRFEDGSVRCASGDADVLVYDPDSDTWRLATAER